MFMNPMGMNFPMNNQMGMFNQMNMMNPMNNLMMDETTSNLKKIVEPYENKIKDLEDQLRKKDFEILVLKEKLNKLENNSNNLNCMNMNSMGMGQPMMNMNMNMNMNSMGMGQPMMNMNMDLDMKKDNLLKELNIITIFFRFSVGESYPPIIQKCFLDDEFEFVKKKSKKIQV